MRFLDHLWLLESGLERHSKEHPHLCQNMGGANAQQAIGMYSRGPSTRTSCRGLEAGDQHHEPCLGLPLPGLNGTQGPAIPGLSMLY